MAVLLAILAILPQILFSEKIIGTLAEHPEDYHSLTLVESTPRLPQVISYFTVARYLYLPLKALGLQKGRETEIFLFNGVFVLAICLVALTLAWVALTYYFHRQRGRMGD